MVGKPFQTDPAYDLKALEKVPEMAAVIWEIKLTNLPFEEIKKGVFLLKDRRARPLAIFKPSYHLEDVKREFLAYLLDHHQFAGVPPLVPTTLNISGMALWGSCQLYVEHENGGHFSARSLRRIAQLDIRLLNSDRNRGNLLRSQGHLVPIDHQIVLPHVYNGIHFDWMHYPQCKTYFTREEQEYIAAIDAAKDGCLIAEWLSQEAAALYCQATEILKKGVSNGWSPFQIGTQIAKTIICV